MKKILAALLSGAMVLGLTACGGGAGSLASGAASSGEQGGSSAAQTSGLPGSGRKAILIVNGSMGDLGFFDSANGGMQRAKAELGMDIQVIETGDDGSKWEPALADAAEEDVDYVIAISASMVEPVQNIAPMYPEKKFLLIDGTVDFAVGGLDNVYCAAFKQNEGSFLAGAAAALLAKETGKLGFVGGQDTPPINDFLVGYIEGAVAVNPNTKVVVTYPGDYYDPAKGKEHGIVLVNQGAEVMFAAAGPTSLGVIEAAVEANKYIIGVDSDQSAGYAANGNQKTADMIATSMLKNVGNAIFRALEKDIKGELEFGTTESLGIVENGVGLAKNDVYRKVFSAEEQKKIEEIQAKVISGEIKVSTAIGMPADELNSLKNSVAP